MKTRDYSIFRNITGNRKINVGHVERLAQAIERKNLLQYFPVLVNERMEVIDGQHRLMAAAKLDYDVFYEKIDGLVLEDVMSINTHSKNWSLVDFVDAYIRLGNNAYSQLREFAEKHHLNLTISAGLLMGMSTFQGGSNMSQKLRAGDFKILNMTLATKIAEQVSILNRYCDFDALVDRKLVKTLLMLSSNESFDFDRLTAKLRLQTNKFEKRASTRYYLLEIEEIYNYHNSTNRVELFASTQVN